MASRRTRIKAVANLPLRKRPNIVPNTDSIKLEVNSDVSTCDEKTYENTNDIEAPLVQDETVNTDTRILQELVVLNYVEITTTSDCNDDNFSTETNTNETDLNELPIVTHHIVNTIKEEACEQPFPLESNTNQTTIDKKDKLHSPKHSLPEICIPPPLVRRKFLKPGVNLNVVKQRKVIKTENSTSDTEIDAPSIEEAELDGNDQGEPQEIEIGPPSNKVVILSEVRIAKSIGGVAQDITKLISENVENNNVFCEEVVLDQAHLSGSEELQVDNSPLVTFARSRRSTIDSLTSDTEYPAPPASPSKINRSRIKAIPKLGVRKASFSASESEDDSKKYGRIRNSSVSSVASTTYIEPQTPTTEILVKEPVTVSPKKSMRNEQTRKLAEARREFVKRFGTSMPDKQKLKMIDLIFYNPSTNPMSEKSNTTKAEPTLESAETPDDPAEKVDDPPEEKPEKENGGNNDGMPVPQIKIGPSGEIVLDEQSLVVENVEMAKQKEKLKNSQLVDGDFETGYGVYKRSPRGVGWTEKETLRFYKALNVIGTDFSLMTQLFPKRSRRDLKMKFKKEEKINKQLVDTAMTQPRKYNYADLKREMEIDRKEEELLQTLKEEEAIQKKKRKSEVYDSPKLDDFSKPLKKRSINPPAAPKRKSTSSNSLNINSFIEDKYEDEDDEDADVSDLTQSDEEEIIPFLKPTRSGRMPKSTIKFEDSEEWLKPLKKRTIKKANPNGKPRGRRRKSDPLKLPSGRSQRLSSTSSLESYSEKMIPGAVVITRQENDNGPVGDYKVYMVTPAKELAPLELESDIVEQLIMEQRQVEESRAAAVKGNNVTIPAEEEQPMKAAKEEMVL